VANLEFIPCISRFPSLADGCDDELFLTADAKLDRLLAGVSGNSPYLAGLIAKYPTQIEALVCFGPKIAVEQIFDPQSIPLSIAKVELGVLLRQAKERVHLTLALIELAGVWDISKTTDAFSKFAESAVEVCVRFAREKRNQRFENPIQQLTGFFVVAFGKLGGRELNYSSDIDLAFFYDRPHIGGGSGVGNEREYVQIGREIISLLSEVTENGYVFRTDVRLRPDPASTPIALCTDAAISYYESVGQTWERAAWIKARVIAGDQKAGAKFMRQMRPFIWRKNLDFAAIEDIYLIRQQIFSNSNRPAAPNPGYNVKLDVGGIREIELFVQTHQLIHGGRNPELRIHGSLEALVQLANAGHISKTTCDKLSECYIFLRQIEHALQMVDDRQTHEIPTAQDGQQRFQRLLGVHDSTKFSQDLVSCTEGVSDLTHSLFYNDLGRTSAGGVDISGFENHPDTVRVLQDAGFVDIDGTLTQFRGWMAGGIRATRSERSQRLLGALAVDLIAAFKASDAPDLAFAGFVRFFEALPSGVQVLSLFSNSPGLLTRVIDILILAPHLADIMANRPHVIEALLVNTRWWDTEDSSQFMDLSQAIAQADDLELAMDVARRGTQEAFFQIGTNVLTGHAAPDKVALAYSKLVETVVEGLAKRVHRELELRFGKAPANWVILGMGKLGTQEMLPNSDLDLMVVYAPISDASASMDQSPPDVWATRFTRRLISSLSAPTSEGELFEVDMKLRPSGRAGPIAVGLDAFANYYKKDAWTWELQALTRSRIIATSAKPFAQQLEAAVQLILTQPLDADQLRVDISDMRQRLNAEKPTKEPWDVKLGAGGLTELEFILQAAQLIKPTDFRSRSLFSHTKKINSQIISASQLEALTKAHALFHQILQITGVAVGQVGSRLELPEPLCDVLLTATGFQNIDELKHEVIQSRKSISLILDHVLRRTSDEK